MGLIPEILVSSMFEVNCFEVNDAEPVRLLQKLSDCFGSDELKEGIAYICALEVLSSNTVSQRRIVSMRLRHEFCFAKELDCEFYLTPGGDFYCFGLFALDLVDAEKYEDAMFFYPEFRKPKNLLLLTKCNDPLSADWGVKLGAVFMSTMNTYFPEVRLPEILDELAGFEGVSMIYGFGGDDDIYPARFIRVIRRT